MWTVAIGETTAVLDTKSEDCGCSRSIQLGTERASDSATHVGGGSDLDLAAGPQRVDFLPRARVGVDDERLGTGRIKTLP